MTSAPTLPRHRERIRVLSPSLHAILLFIAALALPSCGADGPVDGPARRLDEFLGDARVHMIDLDAVPTDTLRAVSAFGEDRVDGGLFIGRSSSTEWFRDSIFIADTAHDALIVADKEYRLIRVHGRAGEGPGEFDDPFDIRATKDYMFVHDLAGRLQAFDRNLRGRQIVAHTSLSGNIDASDSLLFVPGLGRDRRVDVFESTEPFLPLGSMLPNLIEWGRQPGGFNSYRLATGLSDGSTVVAYAALPLLILVDRNLSPVTAAWLHGTPVDEFENPPFEETRDPEPVYVQHFVRVLDVVYDRIVFVHRMTAYVFAVESHEVDLVSAFVFADSAGNPIPVSDLTVDRCQLLVTSRFRPAIHVYDVPDTLGVCEVAHATQ